MSSGWFVCVADFFDAADDDIGEAIEERRRIRVEEIKGFPSLADSVHQFVVVG